MDANSTRKKMSSKELYAGWDFTYDAIVEPDHAAELVDFEFLRVALRDLMELLEMQALVGPLLHDVSLDWSDEDDDLDEGGVAGVVVATTSHITIHTWPLRNRFSLDVFSSHEFDEDVVQDFLKERFNVKTRASRWTVRNWP